MAGRFLPQRDRDFLERINKELIGDLKTNDDGIINQKWNFGFFEVNGVLENQLIGGQQENNWSVTLQSFLSRQSFSNMNRIRSI